MQQDQIEQVVTVARGTDVEMTILPSGVAKSLRPPRFQASRCRAGTVRDKAMSKGRCGTLGVVRAPEGGQRSSTKGRLINRGCISMRDADKGSSWESWTSWGTCGWPA